MDSLTREQMTLALSTDSVFAQMTKKEARIKHLLNVLPLEKLFNNVRHQVDRAHFRAAKSAPQSEAFSQEAKRKEQEGDLTGALFFIKKALLNAESPGADGSPLVSLYKQLAVIQQKLLNFQGAFWAVEQSQWLLEQEKEGVPEEATSQIKVELSAFLSQLKRQYEEQAKVAPSTISRKLEFSLVFCA